MKKLILLTIFVLFFLAIQKSSGVSLSKNNFFEIETKFGLFPLKIPDIMLTNREKFPLVKVYDSKLPDLPDRNDPRFIPDNPSWLDQAGLFYKEGIENYFLGELKTAFKRFKSVIDEYPETKWFYLSLFWHGQVSAKQSKFLQAEKSINLFLESVKSENRYENFSEYKDFSVYNLVWLKLKQREYEKAFLLIQKFESTIDSKELQKELHYLKYYTYQKLKKSKKLILSLLIQGTKEFTYSFEHLVRLAEYYYKEKRWQDLSDLVSIQSSKSLFYNDPQMEHFFWLGVVAEKELKKWSKVRKKLEFLEKLGVRNQDILSVAFFRLHLNERKFFKAWKKWNEIDDKILKTKSLRELIHFAIINEEYKFLRSKRVDLKSLTRYWRTWQEELELIYAYLYLRIGQVKKANQWLDWSISHSQKKGNLKVSEESLFLKTIIHLISFEYQKAFFNLKKLLENYPDSVRLSDYYFWYGVMIYELEKNHLEALMAIRQVNHEGDRNDDRLYLLGKINYDQKKWRPAILAFLSLNKNYPESRFIEESLFLQSDAYYKKKRYKKGLDLLNYLEKKYSPLKKPIRAIHLKVRILLALKKFEQADDVLRLRIAAEADLSLIRLRVEVLKHIKDPKRILSVTGEGLGISTSEDEGFLYFHRANALYDIEKFQEAVAYYNLAIKNPPEVTIRLINFRILKIQYSLGRISEFLGGLNKFLKVNNEDEFSNEILFLAGNHFLNKDKKEIAVPYFNQLLVNYKKSVSQVEIAPEKRLEQIFLIGKIYKSLNELDLSERWLNQALKSVETVRETKKKWQLAILREKGEILFHLGKHRQALAASLKVLYLDNTMSKNQLYNLNLRIASSYQKLGRPTEASAIYRKMLKEIKTKKKRIEVEKLLRKL